MSNRIVAESKGKIILVDVDETLFCLYGRRRGIFIKIFRKDAYQVYLKELENRLNKCNFFPNRHAVLLSIFIKSKKSGLFLTIHIT